MGVVLHHPQDHRKRVERMNVLHLLVSGGIGGIEILMKNYAKHSQHNNIFVFLWKTGEVADAMKKDGVRIYTMDAGRECAFVTLKKLGEICRCEKVDAVVSHNSAPLLKLALLYMKCTMPKVRVVAYAHANAKDICVSSRKKGLLGRKMIHRLGFRWADGVVAISQSVKRSLKEVFCVAPEKVQLIYNGTPIEPEMPENTRDLERNILRLIYVGRLIPEKGVHMTLRALAEIQEQIPFVFTIVGEGPYRKELENLTEQLQLSDRVRFLGERTDVPQLLCDADVFLHLPNWEEGFGITVIEAMAAGLLCVVNNRGAMPEIVDDGMNGFVIDAQNPYLLGDALKKLVALPPQEQEKLRKNAHQKAQKFSVEAFAKELDLYLVEIGRAQVGSEDLQMRSRR